MLYVEDVQSEFDCCGVIIAFWFTCSCFWDWDYLLVFLEICLFKCTKQSWVSSDTENTGCELNCLQRQLRQSHGDYIVENIFASNFRARLVWQMTNGIMYFNHTEKKNAWWVHWPRASFCSFLQCSTYVILKSSTSLPRFARWWVIAFLKGSLSLSNLNDVVHISLLLFLPASWQ